MKNITKVLDSYIEAQLPDLPAIYNDVFDTDTGDGIISRHDASAAAERRHIDGSRQGQVNVSFYARSTDAATPRSWLNQIINLLDDIEITDQDEGLTLYIEASTEPQFISTDDQKNTIYMATVTVEYTKK